MDEKTKASLNQLVLALRAFTKSVEKSFHHGMYEGATDLMIKQYRTLHGKAAQLLPDDFYVIETLVLDVDNAPEDEQKVGRVMLVSDQLSDYLQGILKGDQLTPAPTNADDLKDLGREFQERILNLTKHTLRRALSQIDVEVNISDEPEPAMPPEPPRPPQPPRPID